MDSILNEYVHESFRTTTESGKIKVFYEPLDYVTSNIEASIYRRGTEIQRFFNSEQDLVFGTILRKNNSGPMPLSGFFTSNRFIVLIWDKDPQEHFLCLSYTYDHIEDNFLNKNWCLEGF